MLSTNAVYESYDDGEDKEMQHNIPIFQPVIEEEVDDDDDDLGEEEDADAEEDSVDEIMNDDNNETKTNHDDTTIHHNNNISDERNHHHYPFISSPPKYDNPVPVYEQASVGVTEAASTNSTSASAVPLSSSQPPHQPTTPPTTTPTDDFSVATRSCTPTATIRKSNSHRHHPYKLPSSRDINNTNEDNNNNKKNKKNNLSSSALPHGDFKGGQSAWQAMLYELMVYRANHENNINKLTCTSLYSSSFNTNNQNNNTKYFKQQHTLYLWLQNQKKHYKRYMENKPSFLNQDRIKVLESIGIEWHLRGNAFWDGMYEKLKSYKVTHGDCLVPRTWKGDKRLGEWVTDQRRQYKYKQNNKATMLSDEREKKLNDIGFAWSLRNRMDWNTRFEQLVKFKHEYGHCIVPQLYNKEKGLGKWVSKQREQYKNMQDGKYSFMTKDRIRQLDSLGFSWNAKGRRSAESLMGCDVLKLTTTTTTATIAGANETDTDVGNTETSGAATMTTINDDNEHHSSVTSPFKDTAETIEKDHNAITYSM